MSMLVERYRSTAPASSTYRSEMTVRHAEPGDAPALHRIFQEPQVVYWTVKLPFASLAETRDWVSTVREGNYILVACAGEQVAGVLGLSTMPQMRCRHIAHIGPVAVAEDWQGCGVGSALMRAAIDLADNWLNLVRLDLLVYPDNTGAIALYRKFGFEKEGTRRALAIRAGTFVDADMMARVRLDRVGAAL